MAVTDRGGSIPSAVNTHTHTHTHNDERAAKQSIRYTNWTTRPLGGSVLRGGLSVKGRLSPLDQPGQGAIDITTGLLPVVIEDYHSDWVDMRLMVTREEGYMTVLP